MSFIHDLQNELTSENPISPIIMKLRLLAAKLGSEQMEEWVRFEAEGYPQAVDLPEYRIHGMSFIGQFSGPFGSGIKNAPIPPYLIGEFAGKDWEHFRIRYSAAAVDSIVAEGNGVTLDLANLALLIQGKVYENMACNQLSGYVSHSAFVEVSNAIRNRILELTINLEKSIPEVSGAELSSFEKNTETVTQVFQQTVYGGVTHIQNTGANQNIVVAVKQENLESLINGLSNAGLNDEDAEELATLISKEPLENNTEGKADFGKGVRTWLGKRVTQGADAGIAGGVSALINVAKEAALQYWGLK